MKRLILLLLAASAMPPVLAQDQSDQTEATSPQATESTADPHAGHDISGTSQELQNSAESQSHHHMGTVPPDELEPAEQHGRHDMGTAHQEQQTPADHDMGAAPHDQRRPADPHAGHDIGAMQKPAATEAEAPPPPAAFSGPVHAADALFDPQEMAEAREQLRVEQGGVQTFFLLADRFEGRTGNGADTFLWDGQGWYGGDINKLWFKSEGEGAFEDDLESAELQVLYSRAVTPFFDLQAGIRHDFRPDPERSHLVVGVQGLVPYAFELDAAAFLSDEGDLTGRLEGEFDLQITQRLILQPRLELNVAAQDIPELGIGSGFSSAEAGLRLRYEIRREFAPYLGVAWERKLGDTGDFAGATGEDRGGWQLALGIRAWF
jgi:copper resistance protein B